ncbi:MAG: MarR family winged helix-turn-helix transcriptional regulator [Eubacteriales bacterium]
MGNQEAKVAATAGKDEQQKSTDAMMIREAVQLFIHTNHAHHSEVERRTASLGIHQNQHRMLMCIMRMQGEPSQRQLASEMGISPAAVTTILKSLEKEGYVARCVTEEDNRRNRVAITEKGRSKLDEAHVIFDSVDQAMFRGMSEADIQTLKSLLLRMKNNLQETGDGTVTGESCSREDAPDDRTPAGVGTNTERKCTL